MSKKFPKDIDYREAIPCNYCKTEIECFNTTTGYVGCPHCEREHPTRAIMRLEGFKKVEKVPASSDLNFTTASACTCSLMAGPEEIACGFVVDIIELIQDKGYTVDGVNYSWYKKRREAQRNGKNQSS